MRHAKFTLKQVLLVLPMYLLIMGTTIPSVSAHELESNNGVSVIFHIEPDDNPTAGEPTVLNMLYSHEAGGFKISNYTLKVELHQGDTLVASYPVAPAFFGATREGDSTITFPSVGSYDIKLIGTAKEKSVQSFKLDYDAKVSNAGSTSGAKNTNNVKTVYILSAFSLIILGMITARAVINGGKYKSNKASK